VQQVCQTVDTSRFDNVSRQTAREQCKSHTSCNFSTCAYAETDSTLPCVIRSAVAAARRDSCRNCKLLLSHLAEHVLSMQPIT
jgi:hypothetical protein